MLKKLLSIVLVALLLCSCIPTFAFADSLPESISYLDETGSEQSVDCVPFPRNGETLSEGWYYLSGKHEPNGPYELDGNVRLILVDGTDFIISGDKDCAFKDEDHNGTLTIYSQSIEISEDDGSFAKLQIKGSNADDETEAFAAIQCETFTIVGGDIRVNGGSGNNGKDGGCNGDTDTPIGKDAKPAANAIDANVYIYGGIIEVLGGTGGDGGAGKDNATDCNGGGDGSLGGIGVNGNLTMSGGFVGVASGVGGDGGNGGSRSNTDNTNLGGDGTDAQYAISGTLTMSGGEFIGIAGDPGEGGEDGAINDVAPGTFGNDGQAKAVLASAPSITGTAKYYSGNDGEYVEADSSICTDASAPGIRIVVSGESEPVYYYYSSKKVEKPTTWDKCKKNELCPIEDFGDLVATQWYHDGIHFCLDNGLMKGVTATTFAPNATTTRAMMMTILARMDGCDTEGGEKWYSVGQSWAITNEISDGTNPDAVITREQFATMLYRYAKSQGKGFVGTWMFNLEATDAADVSEFANEAIHWCVMKGILTGYADGTLLPGATLTRAEAATMIQRYCTLK